MPNVNSHALRMPPDSTGKRIRLTHFIEIPYSGMSTLIEAGDHIAIKRSGTTIVHGFCIFVRDSAGSGIVGLIPHTDHQSPTTGILAGDVLERQETGVYVPRATITGPEVPYYVNSNQLVSYDNPFYGQKVDQYGAAFTRFTEGGVTFDGSGRMRQTNNITIMANEFHDLLPYHFTKSYTGSGTVVHDSTKMCAVLRTDGSIGETLMVSDKYLYHEANAALFADMSVRIGDTGKVGVTREWGLMTYEKDQGVCFRLVGTNLYAVLINKASGASVESPVLASDWSHDTLGKGTSNPSGFKIDVSKVNSYWIEIVQDGAGAIKMGIFNEDNTRILCHVFQGNNQFSDAFLTTGSFPFHFHQTDTGGGSTSEMMVYAVSAELEGPTATIAGTFYEGCSDPITVNNMTSWTPIFSIRPKLVDTNGDVNHNIIMPKLISIDVCDESDRVTPRRIKLEVFRDATLTGAVWAKTKGNSQTDYVATLGNGLGATAMSGGTAIGEWIVRGQADLNIRELFDYCNTYLSNNANGVDQHQLTIAAKTLDTGVAVNIVCALTWEEIESH